MDQRRLHKTIENIASKRFDTEEEMLISVLNEIVGHQSIGVTGGRIWKLLPENRSYILFYQTGNLEKIEPDFELKLAEYPIFDLVAKERTIAADETNLILREKGIFKYSASGVGDKIKIDGKPYYEYLLALNTEFVDENHRLTLSIIATSLTSQIKQRRYSQSASSLKADLDKARELQKSILPEHEYSFYNYELFGITDPAEIVGGDFFDYLEVGDDLERIGIAVGDAASKGVSAAAEAMYISGALRMASNFEIKIAPLMKRMNQLVNKIFDDDKFASLFYGELSTDKSGLFLFSNAGHNPPIFIRNKTDEIIRLEPTGPVLGPEPHAKYTIENINFLKNDVLVIYTDGLIDSANSEFENYGEERFIKLLKKIKNNTSKEIAYEILNDVINFSKNGSYSDDKTLVIIKRIN
ncbi:MAG: serine/threonine-protein phosphatase [Ignavibacteriaceae bacterium]|jgi:sigma-B regulation protein RsbU (phosphoserine phosphatase)|nr:serine/threonine-protein phosphatase [Ignavibacteriaceae bacterium]